MSKLVYSLGKRHAIVGMKPIYPKCLECMKGYKSMLTKTKSNNKLQVEDRS